MLLALSTEHKLGLGIAAGIFIVFALSASFLFPRYRPDFPGRRLGFFVAACVLLFVGMMVSVQIFGKESEEAAAETAETGGAVGAEASSTAPATTNAGATGRKVEVTETEFKIRLADSRLAPGPYVFELKNDGKIPHDLTISGPQVNDAKTPVIGGGKSATLKVALVAGDYDFYCSVPGHKDAGMDVKVTVS